jgi:SAM-dependent methyltransferase
MPADYDILVDIYDAINLGAIGKRLMPKLIDFAQREGWMGRRTLDLGCGAGDSLTYLAQHGYFVTGVDQHRGVLDMAQQRYDEKQLSATWEHQDILNLGLQGHYDLVTAINVLPELQGIRDIERVLRGVHQHLKDGQWFIFDLLSIAGLIARSQPTQNIVENSTQRCIIFNSIYDYERTIETRQYTIFTQQDNGWQKHTAQRILRAYPIQAIVTLVKRTQFEVAHVLTTNFESYEPGKNQTDRVIIVAQKG